MRLIYAVQFLMPLFIQIMVTMIWAYSGAENPEARIVLAQAH